METVLDVGGVPTWYAEHGALYRGIPGSELAVVPGTSHVLIMEKSDRVADIVMDFLLSEPVATIAPIRRRGSA